MLLGNDLQGLARGEKGATGSAFGCHLSLEPIPAIPILTIHRRTIHIQQLRGEVPLSIYPLSHIRALCGYRRQG